MAQEIERKFLVIGDQWRLNAPGVAYRQGYLPTKEGVTVRVRIAGVKAYLTIKSPVQGYTRSEFEYEIPLIDAKTLLDTLCDRSQIEKVRYTVTDQGNNWVVDEFKGNNQGLILAEIELEMADQHFDLPPWIGREVSHDPRYYNSNLAKAPYLNWED